jgi:hypothetical protein
MVSIAICNRAVLRPSTLVDDPNIIETIAQLVSMYLQAIGIHLLQDQTRMYEPHLFLTSFVQSLLTFRTRFLLDTTSSSI